MPVKVGTTHAYDLPESEQELQSHITSAEVAQIWRQQSCINGPTPLQPMMNVITEPKYPGKGTRDTSEQLQILRIPEALFAFTQPSAKANGEAEKLFSGWPLLTPTEIQLKKCSRCPREFCSTINHKRHMRVHRRPFIFDKESSKNRESLCAFWDKLSWDEAKEIVSIKDVTVKDLSGSLVIRELTSLIGIMRLSTLPEIHVKAGMILLDVVTARSSRFPISSKELFHVLEDASESTFMFAGTAQSIEKFIFDGEAQMIALEMKNIVAITSFMLEMKLVEAWLADKAAEALRCQNLLLEEEEADIKRQSEILEKKRLKKLRQKEQRSKYAVKATNFAETPGSSSCAESTSISSEASFKPEQMGNDRDDAWTAKTKSRDDDYAEQEQENEIMIGSIRVPLGNGNDQCSEAGLSRHKKVDEFAAVTVNNEENESPRCVSREGSLRTTEGGRSLFSCDIAEAFLAQRWKGAMEADHVKLVVDHPEDDSTDIS